MRAVDAIFLSVITYRATFAVKSSKHNLSLLHKLIKPNAHLTRTIHIKLLAEKHKKWQTRIPQLIIFFFFKAYKY